MQEDSKYSPPPPPDTNPYNDFGFKLVEFIGSLFIVIFMVFALIFICGQI